MMAFTVCIALLAVLVWGDEDVSRSERELLAIVWGTTLGLALTHWFALTLAVRLVDDPSFRYSAVEMLLAQTLMVLLVAATTSAVVVVVSPTYERFGAMVTAALFLGSLVGVESRAGGTSRGRTVGLVVVVVSVGLAIATVKRFIGT